MNKLMKFVLGVICFVPCVALAEGPTLLEQVTILDTGVTNLTYTVTILYEVHELGAKIVQPRVPPAPVPPLYVPGKGWFLGYYGMFQTSDSGEGGVEFKVFDQLGASVGVLPGVVLPPAPTTLYSKWSYDEDSRDNVEPIIFVCDRFFAAKNANLFKEYDDRIKANPADYEAYICRAFARVATLWNDNDVKFFVTGCNISFDPETGRMSRGATLDTGILNEVRTNQKMDKICNTAVPVFKAAINDLDQLPKDWPGYLIASKETGYAVDEPTDVPVYLDYADAQLIKAVFCEVISFLNLVRGYRDPATGLPGGTNPEALKEARDWWRAAVMQVSAFESAQVKRTDFEKTHFFELDARGQGIIGDQVQNLLDLPYWTVRVNLMDFKGVAFRNEETKNLLDGKQLDVSLRSLFEGKVSLDQGTFPVFWGNGPYLNETPDPTCGGTFPGMSRTMLGEYAGLFGFLYPYAASDEIKNYAVFYKLPPDAKNNPENPATFEAGLKTPITLLNPTMADHYFTGWSNGGVIPEGTTQALTFSGRFAQSTPEEPGSQKNPWEIGLNENYVVRAWTNGTGKLTISGEGWMKNFKLIEAPWYSVRDSITTLEIEPGVTSVGEMAFNNCSRLTRVTIPSSVSMIYDYAFLGCPLSRVIVMRESPPFLLAEPFGSPCQFKGKIIVPSQSVDKYKQSTSWKDYAAFIIDTSQLHSGLVFLFF